MFCKIWDFYILYITPVGGEAAWSYRIRAREKGPGRKRAAGAGREEGPGLKRELRVHHKDVEEHDKQ